MKEQIQYYFLLEKGIGFFFLNLPEFAIPFTQLV